MTESMLDWPQWADRTENRENTHKFDSNLRKTRRDLKAEMNRLGPDDWRLEESGDDPGVILRWKDGQREYAVACDAFKHKRDNLREVYLWVNETRMREQREVHTAEDEFAAARLPSPDDEDPIVIDEPPHEVLDVAPDAPDEVVNAAYRAKMKTAHPDQGGSHEEKARVKQAKEALISDE